MTKRYLTGVARFWQYVEKHGADECWPWTGVLTAGRYGVFTFNKPYRGSTTAHRYSYVLANGPVAPDLLVRHTCDNPPCCNPRHLIPGTALDNHRDMVERQRADWQNGHKRQFGPRYKKLSDDDVRAIRLLHADGKKAWEIAPAYHVAESHVYAIISRTRKGHVV